MKRFFFLLVFSFSFRMFVLNAQPSIPTGQVDLFMGVDLNYRDIFISGSVYEFLINLTPGIKWNMGKGWQATTQALIPVYNDYGDRYKKIRLNMAVLSKEMSFRSRWYMKVTGGLFGKERYGLDVKGMYIATNWLAIEAQAGLTGYCSMAAGWEASTPKRLTALIGTDVYLNKWNTQFRIRGGRFVYEDCGGIIEAMRHFNHCTVGVYAQYSNLGRNDAGFKIIMMIPPYKRKRRTFNIRPASNFRYTYRVNGDPYSNIMYTTDPEENEREGWFDRDRLKWGSNCMKPDFEESEANK